MDNRYVSGIICRALINIAGDLAIELGDDVDLVIERALNESALQIEKHGINRVIDSVEKYNPRLHKLAFDKNNGVRKL
jgi:hypothetical protein